MATKTWEEINRESRDNPIDIYNKQLEKYKHNPTKLDKIATAIVSGGRREAIEYPEPENTIPETTPVKVGRDYSVKTRKQAREEYRTRKKKELMEQARQGWGER